MRFLVLFDKYMRLAPYFTVDAFSKTESNFSHKVEFICSICNGNSTTQNKILNEIATI